MSEYVHTAYVILKPNRLVYLYGRRRESEKGPPTGHDRKELETFREISDLAAQITRALAGGDVSNLQRLGMTLYKGIIPERFASALSKWAGGDLVLYLDPPLSWIPWELVFDGTEFLCRRFRVSRSLFKTGDELEVAEERAEIHRRLAEERAEIQRRGGVLILKGEVTNPPLAADKEIEEIARILIPVVGNDRFTVRSVASKDEALGLLMDNYHVCHFIGHGVFNEKQRQDSGWRFPKDVLTCAHIENITVPGAIFPRLIVANSCDSARSATNDNQKYVSSLYHSFLSKGIPHYIGTIARVPDDMSRAFSIAFYRALASGKNLGQAIFEARQATSGSLGWGYYVHYGDPGFRMVPAENRKPLFVFPEASKLGLRPLEIVLAQRKQPSIVARRSRELQEASLCIEQLTRGSSSMLLVEGEAGAGKSVFLMDMLEELRRTAPTAFCGVASCKRHNVRHEYIPFKELLQSFIVPEYAHGPDTPATVDDRALQVIARFPQLFSLCRPDILFAGDWPHVRSHLIDQPAGAPADKVDHYHLERELHAFIVALCAVSPVVLAVEDLQWADETSLDLFFYLRSAAPLLQVGTYRSQDIPETLRSRLRDAGRRDAKTIPLDFSMRTAGKYTDDTRAMAHTIRYLRKRLPVSPASEKLSRRLVSALVDHSGGNTFFLSEVVNILRGTDGIKRRSSGAYGIWVLNGDALGELHWALARERTGKALQNLIAHIEERLAEAGEDLRVILSHASIQGSIFSLELLAELLGTNTSVLRKPLAALQGHRLIEETGSKIRKAHILEPEALRPLTTFTFRHEVIMHFLHEALNFNNHGKFKQLHGIAAEYLETLCGDERGRIAAQLSDHFSFADNLTKALEYSLIAARQYRQQGYMTDAREYYHISMQLGEKSSEAVSEYKELRARAGYGEDLLQDYFGTPHRDDSDKLAS